MALRLFTKINRNIIQNLGKVFFSGKPNAKAVRNLSEDNPPQTIAKDVDSQKTQIYGTHVSSLMQHIQISSEQKMSEADIVQTNLQRNHLQPSRLAEYYKPPIDMSVGTYPNVPNFELDQSKGASQYRTFEKSTTYKSVKLPLKKPKLVSPFPDPVKVMPSDTMSDLEKADLKEAEARVAKADTKISANFSQCRFYSSSAKDDGKCKPLVKKKKQCPTQKSPCKTPAKVKICDDSYKFKPCQKKKAPYHAYSEFCHTIPDEKPAECKICPWKDGEHPTFKTPKKKFHTSSIGFSPRKRYHEKQQLKADRKRGWVEQEKWREVCKCVTVSIHETPLNAILCANKPCKPPKSQCDRDKKKSKSKKKKKKGKKKKQKGKKSKKGKKKGGKKSKKPKKKATAVDTNSSWVTLGNPESLQELPTLVNHRTYFFKSKKKGKGKNKNKESENFTKFPFRGCNIEKPKEEKPKCQKTKIRNKRGVNDCPPDKCKKTTSMLPPSIEYLLEKCKKPKCPKISPGKCQFCGWDIEKSKREGRPEQSKRSVPIAPSCGYLLDKSKKPKCPAIETDKCKKDEEDDPCKLKRTGKTKECPKDLLKKKRRKPIKPRKKTQGVITPLSLTSTLNQPIPSTSSQHTF